MAGAVSIVAHGVAGALLVETLRPAPINQQTLPETSLDLIGYEAPRGDIIEKDAGGATAREADADATQLSQRETRRVIVRTTPPPTSYAALQRPASARTQTALQTMQNLDSVDLPVSAASELDTDGEILDAQGPEQFPLVDEILMPGQQTLTAVITAKVPLLQTVPTETTVLSSLIEPDALEPIPSRETRAASPPPVSKQAPSGSLKFYRTAVVEPFETALDAPSPPGSKISISDPVGEETTMLAPPASNTLTGKTVTPVPTPAATLANVMLTAPAPSGLKLSAETKIGRFTPTTPPAEIAVRSRNPISAEVAATTAPRGATVGAPSPSGPFVPASRPASLNAPVRPPLAIGAPAGVPDSLSVTAGLAWSGAGEDSFDPVSLAAIQSFVTEEDLRSSDAGTLRDGIADLLAQVPCARLQVAFDPVSGTLALRGHVPEAGFASCAGRRFHTGRRSSSGPATPTMRGLGRNGGGWSAAINRSGDRPASDRRRQLFHDLPICRRRPHDFRHHCAGL